jgi:hypothetical protein
MLIYIATSMGNSYNNAIEDLMLLIEYQNQNQYIARVLVSFWGAHAAQDVKPSYIPYTCKNQNARQHQHSLHVSIGPEFE